MPLAGEALNRRALAWVDAPDFQHVALDMVRSVRHLPVEPAEQPVGPGDGGIEQLGLVVVLGGAIARIPARCAATAPRALALRRWVWPTW